MIVNYSRGKSGLVTLYSYRIIEFFLQSRANWYLSHFKSNKNIGNIVIFNLMYYSANKASFYSNIENFN